MCQQLKKVKKHIKKKLHGNISPGEKTKYILFKKIIKKYK